MVVMAVGGVGDGAWWLCCWVAMVEMYDHCGGTWQQWCCLAVVAAVVMYGGGGGRGVWLLWWQVCYGCGILWLYWWINVIVVHLRCSGG